jgi:hypothetical protein
MNYLQGTKEHEIYTMLAAGFCERWSRQEKASVRLPCSGKKLAANNLIPATYPIKNGYWIVF